MASSSSSSPNLRSPPSEKLTRANYPMWRAQVMPAIRGARLTGLLDGSVVAPSKTVANPDKEKAPSEISNPAYETWLERDQQVLSYLLNSLSKEVLIPMMSARTCMPPQTEVLKPLLMLLQETAAVGAAVVTIGLAITVAVMTGAMMIAMMIVEKIDDKMIALEIPSTIVEVGVADVLLVVVVVVVVDEDVAVPRHGLMSLARFAIEKDMPPKTVGYGPMHKGVKCLEVSTGRVYVSRDVVFDEAVFPFKELHPNAGALLRKELILLDQSLFNTEQGDEIISDSILTNPANTSPEFLSSAGARIVQNGEDLDSNRSIEEANAGTDNETDSVQSSLNRSPASSENSPCNERADASSARSEVASQRRATSDLPTSEQTESSERTNSSENNSSDNTSPATRYSSSCFGYCCF
ncbi:hypothetical protein QYE76_040632 [Lolium multiflorum]|uniref:Retroviral polymerase SH3-like domain-containing protein n=1 Tax=Lolium multiflorum TaxID=4521 RepID=A0AAD8TDD8_LOLMU|nr:hypothetical protein QYE76_040632 [Lolium multiflorum]